MRRRRRLPLQPQQLSCDECAGMSGRSTSVSLRLSSLIKFLSVFAFLIGGDKMDFRANFVKVIDF
jgi:hypothetical protein